MKDDNKVRSTVTHVYVQPGDVFIGHDSTKDKLIRYAQKLSGTIKYANFVHGGIIAGLGGDWLVHSNGRDESGAGTLSLNGQDIYWIINSTIYSALKIRYLQKK